MSFLDKLPKIPFLNQISQKEEYYFGLNIEENTLEAMVWGISGHHIRIFSVANQKYSHEDEIIEKGNIALDEVLGDLPVDISKILFGVPDSWLQDDDLRSEYLKLLRRMVKEWDVVPMAYVSTTQAITHFLQKQQGVPLTAVLVKISDPLSVSVVKAGKVVATKSHKRSDSLPQDIERALLGITDVEVLPSKILIYGEERLSKFKDELASFPWMAQLPFLHLPKIDELPPTTAIEAVALAGGCELHPHINFKSGDIEMLFQLEKGQVLPKLAKHLLASEEHEDKGQHHQTGELEEEETAWSGVEGLPTHVLARRGHHNEEEQDRGSTEHHERYEHSSALAKFQEALSIPFRALSKGGEGPVGMSMVLGNKMLLLPILLVLFLLAIFLLLPKAKVTIFMDMRVLEKDAQVTADPNITSVDESSKSIPGRVVETDITGSGKGSATGKKKVGEAAKGKVIIYNKSDAAKNFSSGTVLIGPNNIKFVLDSSVKIASQSSTTGADFSTIIQPGKSDPVGATAFDIGVEGNISGGTELSVQGVDKSQVVAKADTAFLGGVSKEVTVVIADDQKRLLAQVSSDLRRQAQEKLQGKLSGDMKILAEGLSEVSSRPSYSKAVGDQASDFNLNLTVHYKGTAYSDTDLKSIVSKLVETNVPQGFDLDLTKTETQADVSKLEKDGRLIFLAKFKAKLMPKLDQQKIKKELAGKTPNEANEIVRRLDNVIGANVEIKPISLPGPLQRLPLLPQNISLEVTAK